MIDRSWFDAHPNRSCYARVSHDGWALIVRQIPARRGQAPVMLRVWARLDRVPEDEGSCLALWQRWAYPQQRAHVREESHSEQETR